MAVRVTDVYRWIDRFAPFSTAEEWDNAGLLAGDMNKEVDGVLCALDLNESVIDEAVSKNAQLIVTHHPILFRGRKNLREDDPEGRMLCKLLRAELALIAAHTNFDNAQPGVNDALAQRLGLTDIFAGESGMRTGTPAQRTLGNFLHHAERVLGTPIRCYGDAERSISRVSVLGGAGDDFAPLAREAGADVYLTGEIGYHKAMDAYYSGVCVLEAGHAATEWPAISMLADGLQKAADGVQCSVRIYLSETKLFR